MPPFFYSVQRFESDSALCGTFRLQESLKLADAGRVTELSQAFGLNLPDPLTGHLELLPDLLQRSGITVMKPESEFENLPFPLGQGGEHLVEPLSQEQVTRHIRWILRGLVLDKVAKIGIPAIPHRGLERDGLLRHL